MATPSGLPLVGNFTVANKANIAKSIAVGNAIVCYDVEIDTPSDTEKSVGVFAVVLLH